MKFGRLRDAAWILAAMGLMCMCAPDDGGGGLTAEERAWLRAHDGKIRLGPDPHAPPLDFFDELGRYSGLTADYVHLIEKKLGFKFEIVRMNTWDDLLVAAQNKEIDVVCAAKWTPQRDQYLRFTQPFIKIPEVIVTREEVAKDLTIEDLRGKRVVMVKGYAILELVRQRYPWLEVRAAKSDLDGLLDISFARADAMIIDLPMASYIIEKTGIENLSVAGTIDIVIDLGFASRKDLPILHSILEKGLAMVTSEERQAIHEKWISLDLQPFYRHRSFWLWIGAILTVPVLITLATLSWNRILAYQVKQRTAELHESLTRLRTSEEQFRALVTNVPGVTYRCAANRDRTMRFISSEVQALSGYPVSDFLEDRVRPFASIIHPEDRAAVDEATVRAVAEASQFTCEYRILTAQGEVRWVQERGQACREGSGEVTFIDGLIVDVTEQKRVALSLRRSEEQLARMDKMKSLGLMAAGIAHDLNNILCGIVSYPDLMLLDLPDDSPLREPLVAVRDAGTRAADIVADLLTVARGAAAVRTVEKLSVLVEQYVTSPEHERIVALHPDIGITLELDKELPPVKCSATHIKKCLMNLVMNGAEAITGSGTVTIATRSRHLREAPKGHEDMRPGHYAVLSVSDTGAGIQPDDLERVFEPFYSSKSVGRSGTGLGLSVVWNTVRSHDGYTIVQSSSEGTVFELYFPVTSEEPKELRGVPTEAYMGKGERVLVVDDEKGQREIAAGMLARLGYAAHTVSSGAEALSYLQEHAVDLMVLDMIMDPGMSGRETYEALTKLGKAPRTIIVSGLSEQRDVEAIQALGVGGLLKKPYTLQSLGSAIRDELDA